MVAVNPPKGYILDSKTAERIEFQYNPIPIRDRKSLMLNKQRIPGASHPRVTPSTGGPREVSFTLNFYAEEGDPSFVEQKVAFLRSLEYPHAGQNFETHRAPLCFFVYGKLYKLPCYIEKVDLRFDEVFDPADLRPWYAFVDIVLVEAPQEAVVAAAVRTRGAGFRVAT